MRRPRDDYNTAWTTIVTVLLSHLFALFFPDVWAEIDWDRGVEFLDKELDYAVRLGGKGKRAVDKLVKVWLKSGYETWMLLHLEFQNQVDATFPRRMFIYSALMLVRHEAQIASFGILGDPNANWRPDSFESGRFGSTTGIRFRTVKLLDFRERREELERSDNPFAMVVLAHLDAMATRRNARKRRELKEHLTVQVMERPLGQDVKVDVWRFLQLVMPLPEDLERDYEQAVREYERRTTVPVMTQWEKRVHKEGRQEGRQEGQQEGRQEGQAAMLLRMMERLFGPLSEEVRERVARADTDSLLLWSDRVLTAKRLDDVLT